MNMTIKFLLIFFGVITVTGFVDAMVIDMFDYHGVYAFVLGVVMALFLLEKYGQEKIMTKNGESE